MGIARAANPIPGLPQDVVEELFTSFKYPIPDPSNVWNAFPEVYSNREMLETLTELSEKVSQWLLEKKAGDGPPPVFLGMLNGCAPLFLWLRHTLGMAKTDTHLVKVSTYDLDNRSMAPTLRDPLPDLRARDVLLIDDMGDSFRTEHYLREQAMAQGARSVSTCVLIMRGEGRNGYVPTIFGRHLAKDRPALKDHWLTGFGLDGHGDPATRVVCDEHGLLNVRVCPKSLPDRFSELTNKDSVDIHSFRY